MDLLNMTHIGNLVTELGISTVGLGKEALKKKISTKKKQHLLDTVKILTYERPKEKNVKDLLITIAKHLDPNLTISDTDASPKKETLCWNY